MSILWHGWHMVTPSHPGGRRVCSSPRGALHIGPLPRRQGIALYLEATTGIKVLAYFRDEEAAALALDFLDRMAGVNGIQQ